MKFKVIQNSEVIEFENKSISKALKQAFDMYPNKDFELQYIPPCTYQQKYEFLYKTPKVGDKCSMILYSDIHASKITKVYSPKKIGVRHCEVVKWDDRDQKHEYSYGTPSETEFQSEEEIFTFRKNGHFCAKGQNTRGGVWLSMTSWVERYDNHF